MALQLNDILNLSKEEISNSKIEFNMHPGSNDRSFLDLWLKHSEAEKSSGSCKDCSFWGWYGNNRRNFRPGQLVFSFIRITEYEWLFVSAAKIIEIPKNNFAKVEILDKYKSLYGRLIAICKKGNTYSQYVFNLNRYLTKTTVKEILPAIYGGKNFEGYDKVNLRYFELADVFSGKILPTYYEALKKVAGIYCLTDTNTGKLYIGSARGGEGVAQRWGNYLNSKDGGNKKLIALHKKKGEKYFEKYFTYTLIEYFNLSFDKNKIFEREEYWKKVFDTIKHGYNG